MDERVRRIKTPGDCEKFARNAIERNRPDLANEAKRREIELRAKKYGATSTVELEALQAVYAYEQVLAQKNGKRTSASRTWQMIKRRGILEAVERAVNREVEAKGYLALVEMGLEEFAFEAIIIRHPESFSTEALVKSNQRLEGWRQGNAGS